jgi:hypothetical protein
MPSPKIPEPPAPPPPPVPSPPPSPPSVINETIVETPSTHQLHPAKTIDLEIPAEEGAKRSASTRKRIRQGLNQFKIPLDEDQQENIEGFDGGVIGGISKQTGLNIPT